MDHNKTPEKPKSDQARIPSPGSASSVHSIRPLEWDSGADIGYQNTSHTDLSTVERMALANGTASLYKSNETTGSLADRRNIGNPLAESSPFVRVSNTDAVKPPLPEKPLVDYSISDYSADHSCFQELLNAEVIKPEKALLENSRSLEDLRHSRRVQSLNGHSKSRSSQNVFSNEKHQKRYTSSSSVATVIPQENRKVSNKSIQVDENSLLELLKRSEFFQSKDDDYSTYTVDNYKPFNSGRSRLSDHESNSESVDGGSFEYVPGSQYNSSRHVASTLSTTSSGINTLCTEVIDGVDLITKYVNNLNVSNKNKVIQKVAQSLMNQVRPESAKTPEGSDNSLKFEANLPSASSQFAVRVDTPSQLLANSDMVFEPIDKPNQYPDEVDKSSTSKFESTSVDDPKSSESLNIIRKQTSRRPARGRIKSRILESSDFSRSSTSVKTIPTVNGSNSYAASGTENSSKEGSNVYSLKKYLAKEREAQLLWIKSGIDHLNNLKKLYESQKVLKKDLAMYKKNVSKETSTTASETEPRTKRHHLESSKLKRTPKSNQKSIQTSTSDLNEESRHSLTNRLDTNRNTISTRKLIVKKYCKKVQQNENDCQCRTCNCCGKNIQNSENKENIPSGTPRRNAKKAISYTVLFDKAPGRGDQKYHIKQQTVKKSFCKTIYFAAKSPKATPVLNFKPLEANQCPSLQEYLLKNKPEYVDRAEIRRQCLSEIAQLRELRDKSKTELMSLIGHIDESDINTIRQHLPPAPLSVMRIFNDHTLRKQTFKKYQQLPEVQMRKLEQKRRESNRRNQIMAKVFTRKLQRKALKGQVNLGNSVSVISN